MRVNDLFSDVLLNGSNSVGSVFAFCILNLDLRLLSVLYDVCLISA